MWKSKLFTAAVVSAAATIAFGIGGCAKTPEKDGSLGGQHAQPARLVTVPGATVKEVILTQKAAAQVGIKLTRITGSATSITTPVASPAPTASASALEQVPVTAIIYDPDGNAWTYTIPEALTYLRVPVVVDHVTGDTAYLSSGPAVGTEVVAQGAPELLGVEYGVGEE